MINESVAPSLRKLAGFDEYKLKGDEDFVVFDVSNPEFLDEMVELVAGEG